MDIYRFLFLAGGGKVLILSQSDTKVLKNTQSSLFSLLRIILLCTKKAPCFSRKAPFIYCTTRFRMAVKLQGTPILLMAHNKPFTRALRDFSWNGTRFYIDFLFENLGYLISYSKKYWNKDVESFQPFHFSPLREQFSSPVPDLTSETLMGTCFRDQWLSHTQAPLKALILRWP